MGILFMMHLHVFGVLVFAGVRVCHYAKVNSGHPFLDASA